VKNYKTIVEMNTDCYICKLRPFTHEEIIVSNCWRWLEAEPKRL